MNLADRIKRIFSKQRISHHPELENVEHVSSEYSDQVKAEGGFADYAEVYGCYAWVHKAVSLLAGAVATLPVEVVDRNGKAIPGHPVSELLRMVNDRMSPADLWQSWVIHMLLSGEECQEIVPDSRGRPAEIWPRRPDLVAVVPDVSPARLYYPSVALYVFEELKIEPEHMIHSRFYNPLSPWRGLAPIAAVREGIAIDLFAQAWSKTFLKRGARPDYALVAPQGITNTERQQYEMKLAAKFGGVDGWHKPIVLEEGVTDIKVFSFPPKDIEWLQQREFARDEVAAIFNVPDEMMGFGKDTYENFQTAERVFWRLGVMPLATHRDTSLTHHFTKVWGLLKPGEVVRTDASGVAALQDDVGPRIEQGARLWGMGVPFDRVDERLGLGIGPIPGGDVGYLPFSVAPADERGREGEGESGSQGAAATGLTIKALKTLPEYGSARHKAIWKRWDASLRPWETEMKRQLRRDFQRQQDEALRSVREFYANKGAEATAKGPTTADVIDVEALLQWAEETGRWEEAYRKLINRVVAEFGEEALIGLGLEIRFDLQSPAVQQAIRMMAIQFAKDINATTMERIAGALRTILAQADEEGWGIPEIQREVYGQVSEVFNTRKKDYETERIARTEINKAANMGNLEGMRQSGVVEKKGWVSALDDRTRTPPDSPFDHVGAHGEEVAIDGMFLRTGQAMAHPGDPSGDPGNIINCRCTVVAVIE